jgi:localization factor PodJL
MVDNSLPWSVKGVEPEAREAAKLAARRAGMTLGAWLNRVIRTAAAEELAGPRQAGPAPKASDPPQLPALPIDALVEAVRKQMEDQLRTQLAAQSDELKDAIRQGVEDAIGQAGALSAVPGASGGGLDALDVAQLGATVARLDELAQTLGKTGDLNERVGQAEAAAAKAALAVGPLERTVVRLSERLNNVDDGAPAMRASGGPVAGAAPARSGFLSRLFGG